MSAAPAVTVDVRDMLCAQALAVVNAALAALRQGEVAEILYNAADVKQDLLVWAAARRYPARVNGADTLHIERIIQPEP